MHVLCVAAIIAIFGDHNVGRHLKRSFSSVLGTKMIQMNGIPELEKAQEIKKTFHLLMKKPPPKTKYQSYQTFMEDQTAGIQTYSQGTFYPCSGFDSGGFLIPHALVLGRTESLFTIYKGFIPYRSHSALQLPSSFI